MTTILVVDDEPALLSLAVDVLEEAGFDVLTATHGGEALAVLETHSPHLILLDMRMPVVDGVEFSRLYHERYISHRVPIVIFTAATDAEAKAAQVGARAYIAKPFDLDELVALVHAHALTA